MRKRTGIVMGLLVMGTFVACGRVEHSLGGSEVRQKSADGAHTGKGASQDAGPTLGTDGATALPPAAPAAKASPASISTTCGTCAPATAYGNNFAGCCLDDGTCGVFLDALAGMAISDDGTRGLPMGCQPRDQVGVLDPTCPSLYTGNLNGCCRSDNTCGADVGVLGLGCVQQVVMPPPTFGDAGSNVPIPQPLPPAPCTYSGH